MWQTEQRIAEQSHDEAHRGVPDEGVYISNVTTRVTARQQTCEFVYNTMGRA